MTETTHNTRDGYRYFLIWCTGDGIRKIKSFRVLSDAVLSYRDKHKHNTIWAILTEHRRDQCFMQILYQYGELP